MKFAHKTWLLCCICILVIASVVKVSNGQNRGRHSSRSRGHEPPPRNRGRQENDARRRHGAPQGRGRNPMTRGGQTNRAAGGSVFGSFLDLLGISSSSQSNSFTWSIGDENIQINTDEISDFFGTTGNGDNEGAVTESEETTPSARPPVITTPSIENLNRPWRGEGSFTGDMRLGCMDKKCAKGVVEIYNREHNAWGLLCGANWGIEEARVVCNYLQFGGGARRALSLQRKKIPKASRGLAGFFSNVGCNGDEKTITECSGERLESGECEPDRVAAVTCAGKRSTSTETITCGESEVLCGNQQMCVPPSYSCDGMADCPWGTDEENCASDSCPTGSFYCGRSSGNCIANLLVCDGENNCPDGSDESSCEDHLTHFRRKPEVKLPLGERQYSTGWRHVSAYACAKKCREEKRFQCASFDYNKAKHECHMSTQSNDDLGLIVPSSNVRKNWIHFEMRRLNNCRQFLCGDQCISTNNVCDGIMQCLDGTDEQNCEPERADIPVNAVLRLAAGPSAFEGRLEISAGDSDFGLICDVGWTINEANVACRQLGFRRGAFMELTGQFFSRTNLGYKLSGVRCRGSESSLRDCQHDGWNLATCNMDHEAGVVCKGDPAPTSATVETTTRRRRKITTTVPPTTTTPRPVVTRPPAPLCGNMPPHEPHIRSRVVGGLNADAHEWPWQVGIWLPWQFKCGGSLIDSCWVLTAAHCFTRSYQLSSYTIRLGDHQTKVSDRTEQDFKIKRIISHSRYSTNTNDNDIALLELQSRNGRCAIFNEYVKPVCVPSSSKSFPDDHKCHIIGWGQTESDSKVPFTDVLQEATVPLINRADCIRQSEYRTALTVNMLCAGYMHGGIDTCQGDSGGPLLCYDNTTRSYYVWGVVSWGHGCARPLAPGVYTKVNNYHRWITSITGLSL